MNMIFEQIKQPGANLQVIMTPEMLTEFAEKIAHDTATRILSNVKFDEKPLAEKQACEILGKSRQSLAKYRKSGKLRFHTIGREIYYLQSEINQDMKDFRND